MNGLRGDWEPSDRESLYADLNSVDHQWAVALSTTRHNGETAMNTLGHQSFATMYRRMYVARVGVLMMAALFLPDAALAGGKVTIGIGEIKLSTSGNNRHARAGRRDADETMAFQDMLATALIKTRKFNVIERAQLGQLLNEQALSTHAGIVEGGAEMGKISGVDYLIFGSITELGVSEQAMGFRGAFGAAKKTARMAVDLRIVESESGMAILAESVEVEAKMGNTIAVKGFSHGQQESDPLGDVMRQAANAAVQLIVSSIYPIKVIAVQKSGTIVLNYGNALLKVGDVLDVFIVGEAFVDPDTGEELGAEEEKVGQIQVTSTHAKFSKSTLVEGSGYLSAIVKGSICHSVAAAPGERKKKKKFKLPF